MGKKSTPAPPAAPDPTKLAQAQGQANKDAVYASALTNAVDIYGPFGSTTYSFTGEGDEMRPSAQYTTLTPEGQALYNQQQQIALDLTGRAQQAISSAPRTAFSLDGVPYDPRNVDTSNMKLWNAVSFGRDDPNVWQGGASLPGDPARLPYDPSSYGDISGLNQKSADSVYNEFLRVNQPVWDTQERRLMTNLDNRGLPVGGEAWNSAMGEFQRNRDSAMQGAANQAVNVGHAVAGDLISREQGLRNTAFNEAIKSNQQANGDFLQRLQTEQQLRGQVIGENNMVRNQSINDAAMYLTGAPAMQTPTAPNVPTYQIAPAPYMDATQLSLNQANKNYDAAVARNNSMWQGVGNLASAGASLWMMSSMVLKTNIEEPESFLKRAKEIKIYSWKYDDTTGEALGDKAVHIGPMAEDFAEKFSGDGHRIHIGDAIGCLWKAFQELAKEVEELKNDRS